MSVNVIFSLHDGATLTFYNSDTFFSSNSFPKIEIF